MTVAKKLKEKIKKMPTIGIWANLIHTYCFDSWRLIKRHFFYFRNKKFLSRNIELKNTASGKRVFILACGPSINQQDLKPLKDELCISVNNFFIHPDFKTIKPEYHLFPSSHSPISDEQYIAWFKDAEKYFPDGQKVLVSVEDKYIVDNNGLFKKQNVYYYYRNGKRGPHEIVRTIDLRRTVPPIYTIVNLAIYLAIYIGSKEIYLLGCDHDLLLNLGNYKHFYADENKNMVIKTGYTEWNHSDIGVHFRIFNGIWDTYRFTKKYADRLKINIFNSTPGGLLDIFPRKNLEDVLGKK